MKLTIRNNNNRSFKVLDYQQYTSKPGGNRKYYPYIESFNSGITNNSQISKTPSTQGGVTSKPTVMLYLIF
jgi:hypothetical protein